MRVDAFVHVDAERANATLTIKAPANVANINPRPRLPTIIDSPWYPKTLATREISVMTNLLGLKLVTIVTPCTHTERRSY
jgi:hypothetical protein